MKVEYIDGVMLKRAFIGAAKYLDKHKEEVNELNVFPVPDGDTGTNMSLTMKSAAKHVVNLEDISAYKIADEASTGALMGARGNSGVILSQLLRGFASGLKDTDKIGIKELALAFESASNMAYKAVMKPTEGTILTVARHCGEYAQKNYRNETDIIKFAKKIIEEGDFILNKTPEMLPVLKQAGVVDAGGKGLMCVLIGAFNALSHGEEISLEEYKEEMPVKKEGTETLMHESSENIKFGYCTEFMIVTDYDYEKFREEIKDYGDSMLVVGADNLIKTHIHTNNPGEVLEIALTHGHLKDIKIDNMRFQHEHLITKDQKKDYKKYGFITVSVGDGIEKLFKELNVDVVIAGGQTMNPSTEDIISAIDSIEAEHIIILPNNGNIILAANQAKDLSKKDVHVFPTKTVPEGITSMLYFNKELDVEENFKNLEDVIEEVKTAQVTYAVRDTEISDIKIKKDDIIGLNKGDILSVGKTVEEVSIDLIDKLIEEDSSLITIYYGNGIEESSAEEFKKQIEDKFEDFDIELVYGGQPLYYYLFSIE